MNRLREVREKHGWSQQELGDLVGANRTTVIRWEKGARPQHFFQKRLCSLFQMKSSQLGFPDFFDEEDQKRRYIDPLLPVPSSGIIGREVLFSSIKQILLEEDALSVVVQGLPGVGKTTVLTELASDPEITCHFDGVLWAYVGQQPNMLEIYHRWISYLDAQKNDQAENVHQLSSIIGDRHFLIVVDDVWSLDHINKLQLGRNCVTLISTRIASIAAYLSSTQKVFQIQPLSYKDSLHLLSKLTPEVVDRERTRVKEFVGKLGGLPLGITLIGKYLHSQVYSCYTNRRIQTAFERLNRREERLSLIGTLPEGSVSLHAAIERSVVALSQEARSCLLGLSVLPSVFSEAAALAVTNSKQPVALDELVDSGLLSTSDEGLYTLHQTIADYAHVHVLHLKNSCQERLISYALSLLGNRATPDELEQEHLTIVYALHACYELHKTSSIAEILDYLVAQGIQTGADLEQDDECGERSAQQECYVSV